MSVSGTSPRWGRSIFAVLAGVLVGAALSLGVDEVLHVLKIYPPWGERMSDGLFVLATAYRLVFSVLGCYVIARLAPSRPDTVVSSKPSARRLSINFGSAATV